MLEDASKTAKEIGEAELASICIDLARQVEEMAERYEEPTDKDIGLIKKLTKAFEMAKQNSRAAQTASSEEEEEEEEAIDAQGQKDGADDSEKQAAAQ